MIPNSINEDHEKCIDFVLYICDNVNDNIWTNFVISIRNYYDYRIFHALEYDGNAFLLLLLILINDILNRILMIY